MINSAISSHLDQGTLGLYAAGDLASGHATKVESHLAHCAYCRADLRQMEELVVALRILQETDQKMFGSSADGPYIPGMETPFRRK
jgi:anti-sigma factor ChrR (cupin superfamily)